MLTYEKTITVPRLKIKYDNDSESPREWGTLGHFIIVDSRQVSPDEVKPFNDIVKETGDDAKDQADHMKLMKMEIEKVTGEKVLAIYPIVKHEHGNVNYSLGTAHGFDDSNNGFYIVTDQSLKQLGARNDEPSFKKFIKAELKLYTQWANGEVYGFILHDKDGEQVESSWGYYNIEAIRELLPKEFAKEDMADYLKEN